MSKYIQTLKILRSFIGDSVLKLVFASSGVGIFWFLIDSSFVFILQGFFISVGLVSETSGFLPAWYPKSLLASTVLLILFAFVRMLVSILRNYLSTSINIQFMVKQRMALFNVGFNSLQPVSTKETISLFSEVISHSGATVFNVSSMIVTLFASTLFLVVGFKLAPIEMALGLLLLMSFVFPLRWASNKLKHAGEGLNSEWENLNEILLRGLKNLFLLRVYNQAKNEIEKALAVQKRHQIHFTRFSVLGSVLGALPLFIGVTIIALITYFSVRFIHTSPVKLISFFYIFIRLSQAASEMSNTFASIQVNLPGFRKLYRWHLNSQNLGESHTDEMVMNKDDITIQVNNLGFGYDDSKQLFSNLNFAIRPSDVLVIKGESGAGKSTLLSIILGLLKPSEGHVKINAVDTSIMKVDLKENIGYVGPDPYLISGSVRENLLYGHSESQKITEDEIWSVLKQVDLESTVSALPKKLDEYIFDIPQLSTGQKQRLSLARAILRRPSLLILDEATANLDTATEAKVLQNLSSTFRNSTNIIVTHKNSFDNIATQQILL